MRRLLLLVALAPFVAFVHCASDIHDTPLADSGVALDAPVDSGGEAIVADSVADTPSDTRVPTGPKGPFLDKDCDPLVPTHCGFPFPSNVWTIDDAASETGKRVHFGATTLPTWGSATPPPHIDARAYDDGDGFSPAQAAMVDMPGATVTGLPTKDGIDKSITKDSPTIIMEADTGVLIPNFAELDMSTTVEAQRVLMIHPMVKLKNATRYIVAIRNVVDKAGAKLAATPVFDAIKKGADSPEKSVAMRKELYADIFGKLAKAGIAKDDLQLAWDYTTASDGNLTRGMLKIRDDAFGKLGDKGPEYTITKVEENPNAHIRRRIHGTIKVPLYLDKPDPGAHMSLGADGLPKANGTADYPFVVHIPNSATTGTPAPLLQNGHGLLTNADQGADEYLAELADAKNYVIFACDWIGLADGDTSFVASLVRDDMSKFRSVIDRVHQGMLNALLTMRMMKGRFASEPQAQFGGKSAIDPSQTFYRGDSQGGILGATYMALSPDVSRGLLGMAGMDYNLMLYRSADFAPFFALMAVTYPDARDQQLVIALAQMQWDRIEPSGYAQHVLSEPFANVAPKKQVLIHVALGDYQVPSYAGEILARSMGVKNMKTAPRTVFGLEEVASPYEGSALVEWDFGVPEVPFNVPSTGPDVDDPHPKVRGLSASHAQTDTFFRTGKIDMTPCAGGPCKGK